MTETEIPRQQWPNHCQTFSLEHHGWLVSVWQIETRRLDMDRTQALATGTLLAAEQPLRQVTVSPHRGKLDLEVIVGSDAERRTFKVDNAVRLFREREDDAHKGLRIDSGKGFSLLVEFRSPACPEELDGLAPSEL